MLRRLTLTNGPVAVAGHADEAPAPSGDLPRVDIGVHSKVYPVAMELTVSKLGAEVGLTADTIRYYEKARLLPAPDRTSAGYRVYGREAVERLRFIKGAQRLGIRLQEIKELLDIRDRGLCPCGHTASLLDRRVSEIDAEIAELEEVKRDLLAFRGRFTAIDRPDGVEPWPCAEGFIAMADEEKRAVNRLGRRPVVPTVS